MSTPGAYSGRHQATRRALLPDAYGRPCPRCGLPLLPGQDLDLDHTDDRAGYLGFSHAKCNRAAGARKGNALRRARADRRTIVAECAIALEISEDRPAEGPVFSLGGTTKFTIDVLVGCLERAGFTVTHRRHMRPTGALEGLGLFFATRAPAGPE